VYSAKVITILPALRIVVLSTSDRRGRPISFDEEQYRGPGRVAIVAVDVREINDILPSGAVKTDKGFEAFRLLLAAHLRLRVVARRYLPNTA
jgi:hypothetical protein